MPDASLSYVWGSYLRRNRTCLESLFIVNRDPTEAEAALALLLSGEVIMIVEVAASLCLRG